MNKRFRLKRTSDFQRVRRHGKSHAHPLVVLIYLPTETDQIRVGVAAGKAIGNAVIRNRAKRVLRAAIAPLLPHISPGYDLILLARKPIIDAKSTQVNENLTALLNKAGLLTKNQS